MKHLLLLVVLTLAGPVVGQGGGLIDHAEQAYALGKYQEALAWADSAIGSDPASAEAYKLRGDIHQRLTQLDQAMQDYKES